MQEAYVNITDVPTHIMTWGKWIEESLGDKKEVVICITGNPGLPGFYTEFMSTIYNSLNHEVPTWVIGHLGHDDPPAGSIRKVPELKGNENKFVLSAQIKHKIEFITTYIPEDVKIHLIGHSIGAWMVLELLKDPAIKQRVQKGYLLFPTIERMEASKNGYWFMFFIKFFFIIRLAAMFFEMLPASLRAFLIYCHFLIHSYPKEIIGTSIKYLTVATLEKSAFLALDEMAKVRELDENIIRDNVHLLKFYYGTTDRWVPVSYYEELKQKIPNVNAELDRKNIEHSFVLHSSVEMGRLVSDWITSNRAT